MARRVRDHRFRDPSPPRRARGIAQELASIAKQVKLADHFLIGEMDVNLLEELGRGSDAAVYKTRWQGARVAAKVLHPILIQPGNEGRRRQIKRFLRECAVLVGQPHPHVTQCMGVGFSRDGQLLILLELMDATLSSRFTAPEQDSQRQCLVYVRDIAAGLAFLHSRVIIHRDVKPDNCLVRFGHAKLSDVGLARQLDGDDFVVRGTRVPGTAVFMPPEAFQERVPYGTPLDVFGIGVTVLCVFNRKNPDGQLLYSPRHVRLENGRYQEIPEIERREADMSLLPARHCSRPIIEECIENSPDDRPSADDVLEYLEARLKEVESEAEAEERERNALASARQGETVAEGLQISLSEVVREQQTQLQEQQTQFQEQQTQFQEQQTQFQEQVEERFQQQILQIQQQARQTQEQVRQDLLQSAQRQEQGLERIYDEVMTSSPTMGMGGMRRQYRGPLFPDRRREQEDFSD